MHSYLGITIINAFAAMHFSNHWCERILLLLWCRRFDNNNEIEPLRNFLTILICTNSPYGDNQSLDILTFMMLKNNKHIEMNMFVLWQKCKMKDWRPILRMLLVKGKMLQNLCMHGCQKVFRREEKMLTIHLKSLFFFRF